ncbi:unnamed protein product [Tilletia controversa]|uniref:Uncharacterized protein n=3 Tax=Tilletia TaxID=13289 RepID=A0A8X7MUE1_9BASI|nr:hypothetical protein CF335_g6195 [Tilletia laevis]KAE8200812.1 hypothetical protein CF328_g2862 [Tilletia controversa]CAD6889323.1 unnamed protein product [Tilletia caries]KAE8195742.1 hypothetical protein CF336_g2957 [Tilletia laevis]KAE8248846.1 hypothetical protein A4X06_0g3503 [Tilletia controversa]
MASASEVIERVRRANGDPYKILNVAPGTTDITALFLAKYDGATPLHHSSESSAMETTRALNHAYDRLMALPPGQIWTASHPNGTKPPQQPEEAKQKAKEKQKRREEKEAKAGKREEERQERLRDELKKKIERQQASDKRWKSIAKLADEIATSVIGGVAVVGFVYTIRCFSRPPQELAKGVKDMFFLLDVVEAVCMSQIVGTAVVGIAACKIGRSGDVGLLMGTVCGLGFYLRNVGRKVLRASG